MKKIIVILLLLIILGGAGGGAYWWFFMRGQDGMEEEVEEEVDLGPPPIFVEIPALTVPVIRGGNVMRYIVLKISLEAADASAEQTIIERTPGLRNAYLRDLHGYFSTIPVSERLNVTPVKKRLGRVTKTILGRGLVKEILITNAFTKDS